MFAGITASPGVKTTGTIPPVFLNVGVPPMSLLIVGMFLSVAALLITNDSGSAIV